MRALSSCRAFSLEPLAHGSPLCCRLHTSCPLYLPQSSPRAKSLRTLRRRWKPAVPIRSSPSAELATSEDEWLKKLPDKKKALYSHSLPCVEAWLKSLGFCQNREDRASWFVEKPGWHAQLSLDITDLSIRYLKTGPGNLDKDVERRFSYALSREDIENAILGGP